MYVSPMTGPRRGVVCQGRCNDKRSGCGEWFWMVRAARETLGGTVYQLLLLNPSKRLAGSAEVARCPESDSFCNALINALDSGRPLGQLVSGVEAPRRAWGWGHGPSLRVEIDIWGLRRGLVSVTTRRGHDAGLLTHAFLNVAMDIPPIEAKLSDTIMATILALV